VTHLKFNIEKSAKSSAVNPTTRTLKYQAQNASHHNPKKEKHNEQPLSE
jgi:hypothetical protein